MKSLAAIVVLVAAASSSASADSSGGHHHHHHHHAHHDTHHHKPESASHAPHRRQQPQQQQPQQQLLGSPLRRLLARRPLIPLPNLANARLPALNTLPAFGLARFQLPAKRRAQHSSRLRGVQQHRRRVPAAPRKGAKIANTPAELIPGYQKFELHDVIRRREGTEIFDDHKPDVIHYVSAPDTAQDNLIDKIDVRTPDVNIDAE